MLLTSMEILWVQGSGLSFNIAWQGMLHIWALSKFQILQDEDVLDSPQKGTTYYLLSSILAAILVMYSSRYLLLWLISSPLPKYVGENVLTGYTCKRTPLGIVPTKPLWWTRQYRIVGESRAEGRMVCLDPCLFLSLAFLYCRSSG